MAGLRPTALTRAVIPRLCCVAMPKGKPAERI